jgi:hypothetical protein
VSRPRGLSPPPHPPPRRAPISRDCVRADERRGREARTSRRRRDPDAALALDSTARVDRVPVATGMEDEIERDGRTEALLDRGDAASRAPRRPL